ncbi:restriction endonuclease subunit S [Pseudoalteromonas sp. NZS127]|uniref:restriction endonuclease subunit S n=1 Tax=Pseudoalteromonas TaxID=53246 RepID=UPI0018CC96FD|nr:restriction endonuclease subunit S [Pseudoalteromonas sp. NZS127]MBH0071867.1 restriction endonuclease subunit S [Pseudoalteromonas sp. NZS127]|tara:strand:- start:37217 stop:38464 length:1248 start_codon:yes stop_codon:yes gene_type:complete
MSHLNFMDKLLDGYEVEWKPLGEVGEFIRGNGLQKKDFTDTGFPAIHYGQIYTRYGLEAQSTFVYVTHELAKKLKKAKKNDLLLATTSENDEDVVKPLAWLGDDVAISGDMMLYRHSNNVKYLAHFFTSDSFQEQKRKFITGAKVRRVSKDNLAKILIPIPCPDDLEKSLAIQAEIVRILDAFTAMTAELTAELNLRKKQYNYYRDQLLSFEGGEVEWKTLGEVAEYSKARISHIELDDNNYVGVESLLQNRAGKIDSTRTPDSGNLTQYNPGDILIGNIRPYLKKIWHADRVGGTNGDVLVVHPTDKTINPRYLYQVLADDKFFEYNMQHAKGAKMPRGNKLKIMEYLVPVPFASNKEKSLSEQERIVTILDKFDALTSSITEGLPREIELRQKQYEYYRDLLLSFPEPMEEPA